MTGRGTILLCAFLAPFLFLGCEQQEPTPDEPSPRPNVVLIMADDLGWGDVGFHGHERAHTPNLDRLAADGMRFERFYAAAPVCSPTRASGLSGRHPYRYGILHANVGHLPESETNLAELLEEEAELELYDLRNDPGETEDLSAGYPERTRRMREALREWQRSVRSTRKKLGIE